jgi:hypothetical protein
MLAAEVPKMTKLGRLQRAALDYMAKAGGIDVDDAYRAYTDVGIDVAPATLKGLCQRHLAFVSYANAPIFYTVLLTDQGRAALALGNTDKEHTT